MNIIIDHANSSTKRTLRGVAKEYRDTITVSPGQGRINYNNLMTFITKYRGGTLVLSANSQPNGDSERIYVKNQFDNIIFTRHRIGEIDDIIGTLKPKRNFNGTLKPNYKVNLNIAIKPRKQTYFSKFINEKLESVYITSHADDPLAKKWNDQLTASKN